MNKIFYLIWVLLFFIIYNNKLYEHQNGKDMKNRDKEKIEKEYPTTYNLVNTGMQLMDEGMKYVKKKELNKKCIKKNLKKKGKLSVYNLFDTLVKCN
jgi:hypothetical protein